MHDPGDTVGDSRGPALVAPIQQGDRPRQKEQPAQAEGPPTQGEAAKALLWLEGGAEARGPQPGSHIRAD